MITTRNWLRRHRLAAITAGIALTALMLAPEMADAGHRRRARRCCCGGFYGQGFHGGYGYTSGRAGYSYNQGTWSGHAGYANQGIQYSTQGQQFGARAQAGVNQDGRVIAGSEPQPRLADANQRSRSTANRPELDDGVIPPPPESDSATNNSRSTAQDGSQQDRPQNAQQMRQRIQSLEQENQRLRQQLQEARQNNDAAASDPQNRQPDASAEADADAETN